MIRLYGWRPDRPDFRDHLRARLGADTLPPKMDLRPQCPPVLDQGQLGSCTAHAIANAYRFEQVRQGEAGFAPSRLFIYYNERAAEGTIKSDAGAAIRDGIKSVAKQGVCHEDVWPYDIARFAKKPPAAAYKGALKACALQYQALRQTLDDMRACLADGRPFVFGFTVYSSFESAQVAHSGTVPLPHKNERALGGHAVLCVGYDDAAKRFIVMNSWGTGWGQSGYFTIPYGYLTNGQLASDFWTLELVA